MKSGIHHCRQPLFKRKNSAASKLTANSTESTVYATRFILIPSLL